MLLSIPVTSQEASAKPSSVSGPGWMLTKLNREPPAQGWVGSRFSDGWAKVGAKDLGGEAMREASGRRQGNHLLTESMKYVFSPLGLGRDAGPTPH